MERLPRRHRAVLIALRIDEMTRVEAAARFELSLRSVDTALRQALDYCAESAGQEVWVGVNGEEGGAGGRSRRHRAAQRLKLLEGVSVCSEMQGTVQSDQTGLS